MMPGICQFLRENYRGEIETALRLTREEDVEHGFRIVGDVGEIPNVTIIEGEEGAIELGEMPPEADVAITFHVHHIPEDIIQGEGLTADAVIQGSVSEMFSPGDIGAFTTRYLQQEGAPDERDAGFIRGTAIATWGGDEAGVRNFLNEYTLTGIEITENVVGLPFEERMDVAVALGLAYDGQVPDDPRVPDWFPDEEELPSSRRERFELVEEWINVCEIGPFKLDDESGLKRLKNDIRRKMERMDE